MINRGRTIFLCLLAASLISLGCGLSQLGKQASNPTATPIPGWEKFAGGKVELWLPESFDGGDLANDLDVIVDRLKSLGGSYTQLANMIEQNPSSFVLIAYDMSSGSSGFLTNVNVTKERVLSSITLNAYMEAVTSQLGTYGFTVMDQKIVQLVNHEAGRVVIEAAALKAREVMYVIKSGNTIYAITYATGMNDYVDRLDMIQQSANTIKISP